VISEFRRISGRGKKLMGVIEKCFEGKESCTVIRRKLICKGDFLMNKADYAVDCFNSGFNCSQAVFSTFSKDCGLDRKLALRIAGSFGGGMGHIGEACGAVTGAFLVLGLMYGQEDEEDKYTKEKNYLLVKDFASRFRKLNGSISCKELLEYDLSDEKQLDAARHTDVFKTKCPKYVRDAAQILEEMIAEIEGTRGKSGDEL
jgi:C_GCAxxG_C_C family probable redox protein